jgi:hypothetical protein
MKHLLLLLLLAPAVGFAQTFELGLNGGVAIHTRPMNDVYAHQDKVKAGYAGTAKIDLLLPHSQIGIGVEMVSVTETSALISPYTSYQTNHLAKPLIVPHAFYNLIHHYPQSYIYAGATVGLAIANLGINTYEYNPALGNNITGYTTAYNSAIGFVGGLQAGFVASIDKSQRLGINVEAAIRYADYNYTQPVATSNDDPQHYHYFYLPFTAGIRYRI